MSATYPCDKCGACCRVKLVDLFEVDLLREPRLAEHALTLREPGFDGEVGYLDCLKRRACPFLDSDNRCGIYSTRPSVCVVFEAGSEECHEARRELGLPPLEPIVKPQP